MKEVQDNNPVASGEKEIDLLELASKLWANRKKVIFWSIIGAVVGLVVGFSIPKEYTASAKLAPEASGSKGSGYSALAAMAGFNGAGNDNDAVYPGLYPDVVGSIPFITSLFSVEVETKENGRKLTLEQYMKTLRAPWWSSILNFPFKLLGKLTSSGEEPAGEHVIDNFRLTKSEYSMVQAVSDRIQATVNQTTDVIVISVQMQDPLVAAMVTDTVVSRLQEYITDYRTNKARKDLEYAEKINAEAQQEYYRAQKALADYSDRNQGIATQSAAIARDRLANEAQLAFSLYNQTSQRVQAAKAVVQEKTPVYVVVSPPTVPISQTSPRKALILIGFMFVFAVGYSAWILFLQPMVQSRKNKK